MADHVYSRHSIVNGRRSEECFTDKKMMKEFHRPMDKPLDLKQNAISDKAIKNQVGKIDSSDGQLDCFVYSAVNFVPPAHTFEVEGGAQALVGGEEEEEEEEEEDRRMSPARSESLPAYNAEFATVYGSDGFLQLQNLGSFEEASTEVEEVVVSSAQESHDCPICQKAFNNKHNLAKHMNLHTGTEKFQCSVCHKKFSEKGNMTKHMNIHTGSKTYRCPVCNKGFFWLSSLSKHKALHTGERVAKFECPICKKAFGEKGNLTKHMNVHTGQRMFACDVCNKGFYWKSSLIMHRTIHTGHKMYACTTCDRRFRWKTSYNKHMSAHLQQSQATS